MKILINIFFILLVLIACSKKEAVKFEAFSPEAFAYDIGDSWEVNATINVRGFAKSEKDDQFLVSLSYKVDLINPEGEIRKDIFSDFKEVNEKEINDVQLEAQFELDSSSVHGKYKLVFYIEDNISNNSIATEIEFNLED
jgi:hypothetical protein